MKQEVDHFNFLRSSLKPLGFRGVFCSKPDSPCIYLANNNGPDGCALFFREDKFDLISASSRIIEIWKIQSNQVMSTSQLERILQLLQIQFFFNKKPLIFFWFRFVFWQISDFVKLGSKSPLQQLISKLVMVQYWPQCGTNREKIWPISSTHAASRRTQ